MDKITAVMVTRNDQSRQYLVRESVIAFLNQTYRHTELLVVLDHDSPELMIEDSSIREIRGQPGDTLGRLRQLGIEEASGEYIIQWDDDDWHREDAIAFQYNRMIEGKLDACCLTSQIRYSFKSNCAYVAGQPLGHAGTIMHRKDIKHRYPQLEKSEDAEFWKAFWDTRMNYRYEKILNDPCLYLRFCHDHNTWDARHIMGSLASKRDVYRLTPPQTSHLREVLRRYPNED